MQLSRAASTQVPDPPSSLCDSNDSSVVQEEEVDEPSPIPVRVGCHARLRALRSRPELNNSEVAVLQYHDPSERWIVARVCGDGPSWPGSKELMRVSTPKLFVDGRSMHAWLADATDGAHGALLRHILSHCTLAVIGIAAAVDHAMCQAASQEVAERALGQLTRRMPAAPSAVEMVAPRAAEVLPALCSALEVMGKAVQENGGSLSAVLVTGPVLHIAQANDQSCAYRSVQMLISKMLHGSGRKFEWPASRRIFLDAREARTSERSVPSVQRLQRTVEEAWRDGFDEEGARQLDFKTMECAEPWEPERRHLNGTLDLREADEASLFGGAASHSGPVIEYAGKPIQYPHLKLMGAADMWAMLRWVGTRAELHDFIDGPEGEKTSSEILFDWVWEHFTSCVRHHGGGCIRRAKCLPLYLQWAGHAVCVVGACKRQANAQCPLERHLLIFNPIKKTEDVLFTLQPSSSRGDPLAPWWLCFSWAIKRSGRRVTLMEAIGAQASAGLKGPGGEAGPYQVLVVPPGWESSDRDRQLVRTPDDRCTQHVGDSPPLSCRSRT